MPNFAILLKDEIRRLARREVRVETGKTKQAINFYRHEIAGLKRQIMEQRKKVASLESRQRDTNGAAPVEADPLEGMRFSSRSVRAQRRRLGLSAEDYGRLVGVSGLTIYNWEHGKTRPRATQFSALTAIRGIGKREAKKKLTDLDKPRRKPR